MVKKKCDIYIVNSLGNGGAERVVVNLANQSAKIHNAIIITLFKSEYSYNRMDNIKLVFLLEKKPNKIIRILMIPFLIIKLNAILRNLYKEVNVSLITCHLRFSQFLCSLTKYRKEIIYVLHESLFTHENKFWFTFHLKLLYENRNLIAVSKGVEKEIVNKYNVKVKNIKTIYNPIDYYEIIRKSLSKETEYNPTKPYILFCGRLEKIKNPQEMLKVFYDGEFYKTYDLIFIGTGPLLEDLKKECNLYEIEEHVIFLGWQKNPYYFMKNASLLVNCSISEAFPMTLIEAFCCNCRVVSYDINYGPNELLVGDLKKYLARNKDSKSLIDTMRKALDFYPENLQCIAKTYDVTVILDDYYEFYKTCC